VHQLSGLNFTDNIKSVINPDINQFYNNETTEFTSISDNNIQVHLNNNNNNKNNNNNNTLTCTIQK